MEKVEIPDYRAGICASFARGNVGKAVMLASNEDFDHLKSEVLGIMKNVANLEVNQMAAAVKKINEEKYDMNDYLDLCFIWYRDVLLYKACGEQSPLIFKEDRLDIRRIAASCSYEGIDRIIHAIEQARNRLKSNVNADLTMELLFMEMNGAETWMVHICGLILIAGRLMHYYGFHHRLFRWRRSGMSATWCSLLLMVLANLWYMPWELVFSLR